MSYYLIVFHKPSHTILRLDEYEDQGVALGERFKLEQQYRTEDQYEVVVLGTADGLDGLRRTHGRYFI